MDHLWSPWRYTYVSQQGANAGGCLFCRVSGEDRDEENLVLWRGELNFALLNRFPYNNGHLMVVPYRHTALLTQLSSDELGEMMEITRQFVGILGGIYRPEGFNIGMNLGECAGAGIAQHLHLHVLPRWTGDANFMTTVGETRVHPQSLEDSYRALRESLGSARPGPKKT